ncbi:MAG: sigma-54 dependent transcriptional regulator [Bacteroidaceae bacterium]|nr:sigma-54 dependent transcriptional regulator [Bacteroidaceae bacterium]
MQDNKLQQFKQRYSIVGNSDELNRALDIAIQVAPTDLSVLIEGESGVGKEIIPRIIHDNSARKHQKYFAINCGSIPEGTIDSELFGHEKGAFTGAIGERDGYFGAANKGTLFLDEVGELPIATQARLLRVLETGEYIRVGSSEVRKTDVRIVAATNMKLQKAITEGKFREDLYYRLATIPIAIPPLRSRGRDIELLFRKFANDMAEKYHLAPVVLNDESRYLLSSYKWPGNIRQLKNIVEQLSIISPSREITGDILRQVGVTNDNNAGTGIVLASQKQGRTNSYENERDLLFQILGSLKSEIKEIKSMLSKQSQGQPMTVSNELHQYLESGQSISSSSNDNGNEIYLQAEEVTAVEERPKTKKDTERMMIVDSLRRNNGNRNKAAAELGISDRTLYRKINEYGLDHK